MKTLTLLAGMTPDVTALYYNTINQHVRKRLGHRHSAKIYLYSVDLEEQLQRAQQGNWDAFAAEYVQALRPLVSQGAACTQGVALGAIIAHKVSKQIAETLPAAVPFLDITDFVAQELKTLGITSTGLIGPSATMTDSSADFFVGKLRDRHDITVIVPQSDSEITEINRGMLEEVARGAAAVSDSTRSMFKQAALKLIDQGAQAIILGSTDLGFVLQEEDFPGVTMLDPAKVHAVGLAEWMLAD